MSADLKNYPLRKNQQAGDQTPKQRARYVKQLLAASVYSNTVGDLDTPLVDILADLQHYAEVYGVDFNDALDTARGHFHYEQEEDDWTPSQKATLDAEGWKR